MHLLLSEASTGGIERKGLSSFRFVLILALGTIAFQCFRVGLFPLEPRLGASNAQLTARVGVVILWVMFPVIRTKRNQDTLYLRSFFFGGALGYALTMAFLVLGRSPYQDWAFSTMFVLYALIAGLYSSHTVGALRAAIVGTVVIVVQMLIDLPLFLNEVYGPIGSLG
jgi:hypothetical protein